MAENRPYFCGSPEHIWRPNRREFLFVGLIGSLKNIARFLLDCFRYFQLEAQVFSPSHPFQIRPADSS